MEKTTNCWSLYRHTSPSGKVYIGITYKNPECRWNKGRNYKLCKAFFNAILKYGWDNIKHEVLFIGLDELTAKSLEIDLIRHYKGLGISYNITDGGDGMLGYKASEETRKKLSNSLKGKPSPNRGKHLSKNTKRKLAECFRERYKGRGNPNYGNHKIAGENHPFYGKKHKPESIEKMRESKLGKPAPWSQESVRKAILSHEIAVEQYTLNGEFVQEFPSSMKAADYFGKGKSAASHITECCKGKRNKTLGFIWKYKDGKDNIN